MDPCCWCDWVTKETQFSGSITGPWRGYTHKQSTPDTRHQTPDIRYQTPDIRHQTPDIGGKDSGILGKYSDNWRKYSGLLGKYSSFFFVHQCKNVSYCKEPSHS